MANGGQTPFLDEGDPNFIQQQPQQQAQPQQQVPQGPTPQLGEQLQQPPQPDPAIANQWTQFFQDPVNRAGMLSFGLNLLSGGFGTTGQQFAHAAGQGIEAAAGAEKFQLEQERLDEAQDLKEREFQQRGALTREAIAGRQNVALISARARIKAAGLTGSSLANKAMSAATKAFDRSMTESELSGKSLAVRRADAQAESDAALTAIIGAVEGAGFATGRAGAGATRQISPGQQGPGGVPQPSPGAESTRQNSIDFTQVINDPSVPVAVKQAMDRASKTIPGRNNLIAKGFKESSLPPIEQSNLGGPTGVPPLPEARPEIRPPVGIAAGRPGARPALVTPSRGGGGGTPQPSRFRPGVNPQPGVPVGTRKLR